MASTVNMLALASLVFFAKAATELARGWGDTINWIKFEKAWGMSKSENKPLMLVVHKSWCGACKALKPKFASSQEIQNLSEQFIMVNVQDDEEPNETKFKPDGGYIPRILFFTPDGELLKEVYNAGGNNKYKFYYSDARSVMKSMEAVLKTGKAKKSEL